MKKKPIKQKDKAENAFPPLKDRVIKYATPEQAKAAGEATMIKFHKAFEELAKR